MAKTPMEQLQDVCASQARAADVARVLGVSGKTLRQRVRDGRVADPDAQPTPDGKRVALPPVRVSVSGIAAFTDAHKRGLALTYARDDDGAAAILARINSDGE